MSKLFACDMVSKMDVWRCRVNINSKNRLNNYHEIWQMYVFFVRKVFVVYPLLSLATRMRYSTSVLYTLTGQRLPDSAILQLITIGISWDIFITYIKLRIKIIRVFLILSSHKYFSLWESNSSLINNEVRVGNHSTNKAAFIARSISFRF